VGCSERGDLPVDERESSPGALPTRALFSVPLRRDFVVRSDRKRSAHDVLQVHRQR